MLLKCKLKKFVLQLSIVSLIFINALRVFGVHVMYENWHMVLI